MSALHDFKKLVETEKKGFTDDKVLELSRELGKHLASGGKANKENSRTQVRKFFNLVKVAKTSANSEASKPEQVKVKLRLLQAQVTYATAREIISPDFKELFDTSINKIIMAGDKQKDSMNDFATFFEALYAYFYFHTTKKESDRS